MTHTDDAAQWLRLKDHQLFLALSIIVGILAGLVAVLFSLAIDRVDAVFFGPTPSAWRMVLVPLAVSLVTGVLLATLFPDARGSGVPQTKAAFHLHQGVIPARVPIGKFLTGALGIGAGHSMGREGPSVQLGAGIASVIGRWIQLPPERISTLIPIGAAGALAAAFNTPIAAVLFALEEIIGDLNASLLGSTVIASVASVVVERSILGNEPLFRVPPYHLVHPAELFGYAALGVVGGIVSLIFCKALLGFRGWFKQLPPRTLMFQPAIGGLAIGLVLLVAPEVKGVGYEYVDQALNGGLLVRTLIVLGVVKLVATLVSYASGNAGGIFAPSLFIGAMTGGLVGTVVTRLAPFPTAEPGAYALVGMGALFAGIIRAPMTSVFMIFEITQDYQILVPLMVANLLSFTIARRYQPLPVYDALLRQDDVHLPSTLRRSSAWAARDVMTREMVFVDAETSVDEALAMPGGAAVVLVGTPERLLGVLTRRRLAQARGDGRGAVAVGEIADRSFAHVHADHALDVVLERMPAPEAVLPVVRRDRASAVLGVITLESLMRRQERTTAATAEGAAGHAGRDGA